MFAQVAHFYNTIEQQMLPSQKAIMLDSAMAFERIIKNPKTGQFLFHASKQTAIKAFPN